MKLYVVSHVTNHQCVFMKSIAIYATCYKVPEDLNAAVAFDLFGPRFKFVTAFTKDANVASVLNGHSSSAKNAQKYIEIINFFLHCMYLTLSFMRRA